MMTDPIADLLTRIRNACQGRRDQVSLPHSRAKEAIARLLCDEGYLREVEVGGDSIKKTITVHIRYGDGGDPVLPPGGSEPLDEATGAAEAAILGLRLDTGLPRDAATQPPLDAWFGWALAAELLEVTDGDRIVLTTRGRLLSNELFARLV